MIQAVTANINNNMYGLDGAAARAAVSRPNSAQASSSAQINDTKQYLKDLEMPKPSEQTLAKSAFYRPSVWSAKIIPMTAQGGAGFSAASTATPSSSTASAGAQAGALANAQGAPQANGAKGAAKAAIANESQSSEKSSAVKPNTGCQTCQTRQYKDGSDDAGVSFQSSTHVPSATAAISVASHEGEHVSRNSDKAQKEGRMVIQKTVTFQMAFCPECHKMYVAGGTTSMTTAAASDSSANANVMSAKDLFGGTGDNVDTYA